MTLVFAETTARQPTGGVAAQSDPLPPGGGRQTPAFPLLRSPRAPVGKRRKALPALAI